MISITRKEKKNLRWKQNNYLKGMIEILSKMNLDLIDYILQFVDTSLNELMLDLKVSQIQNLFNQIRVERIQLNTEKNLKIHQLRCDVIKKLEICDFTEFYLIMKEIYEVLLPDILNDFSSWGIRHLLYGFYGWKCETPENYLTITERQRLLDKKYIMNNIKKQFTFEVVKKNKKMIESILSFD